MRLHAVSRQVKGSLVGLQDEPLCCHVIGALDPQSSNAVTREHALGSEEEVPLQRLRYAHFPHAKPAAILMTYDRARMQYIVAKLVSDP